MLEINYINSCNNIWDFLSALGPVGACLIALIPFIKENFNRIWLKIYYARLTGCFSLNSDSKPKVDQLLLCLKLKNRTCFDIGIKMARLIIYKKKKHIFDTQETMLLNFGTMARHPKQKISRLEANEFYLEYNKKVLPACYLDLIAHKIPKDTDIAKIKIELCTTVRDYHFRIPKKDFKDIIQYLTLYEF